MTTSKQQILETTQVSDQEALVKLLIKTGPIIKKHIIPGGGTILNQLGKKEMEGAVLNWLRRYRSFSELVISWAKEPGKWKTKTTKVLPYDTRDPRPIWDRETNGRTKLAHEISNIIASNPFLYLHIKPDGIYMVEDIDKKFRPKIKNANGEEITSPDWQPYLEYTIPAGALGQYTNFKRPTN